MTEGWVLPDGSGSMRAAADGGPARHERIGVPSAGLARIVQRGGVAARAGPKLRAAWAIGRVTTNG